MRPPLECRLALTHRGAALCHSAARPRRRSQGCPRGHRRRLKDRTGRRITHDRLRKALETRGGARARDAGHHRRSSYRGGPRRICRSAREAFVRSLVDDHGMHPKEAAAIALSGSPEEVESALRPRRLQEPSVSSSPPLSARRGCASASSSLTPPRLRAELLCRHPVRDSLQPLLAASHRRAAQRPSTCKSSLPLRRTPLQTRQDRRVASPGAFRGWRVPLRPARTEPAWPSSASP
jgi:hypothetical protein